MLFIDIRYSINVSSKSGKFNGGSNYSFNIIKELKKRNVNFNLIINENIEDNFYDFLCVTRKETILFDVFRKTVSKSDVYFCPLISDDESYYIDIKKIKIEKNPKIILTIHDRRHKDNIFDCNNGLLNEGLKSNWLLLGIGRFINSIKKDIVVNKIMKLADKVLTVSNYSMQELLKLNNKININYYTQSNQFPNIESDGSFENFLLCVSSGRSEKNFIRCLKAFERYINSSKNSTIKLIATGLNDFQIQRIYKKNIIDKNIIANHIVFYGYVDNDDLFNLYKKCRFLIFASKSEGYGLPVAEALNFGKPSVVSNRTSIPEILGSCGIYVNPYSIISIEKGIAKLMNDSFYNKQVEYINERKRIVELQRQLDIEVLMSDILDCFNK